MARWLYAVFCFDHERPAGSGSNRRARPFGPPGEMETAFKWLDNSMCDTFGICKNIKRRGGGFAWKSDGGITAPHEDEQFVAGIPDDGISQMTPPSLGRHELCETTENHTLGLAPLKK